MKTTWIITSALDTGAGVYDAKPSGRILYD